MSLKTGDLLFMRAKNSRFEKMIADSTSKQHNYTHVGILIDEDIIHATTKYGCIKQSLDKFIESQASSIDVFRIINQQIDFNLIKKCANNMIGLPYNYSFLQSDKGIYCSELITEIFKNYHIFQLIPLKFGTGKQIEYWKAYYQKLEMTLPEHELGSSPNSLVDSGELKFIKEIKKQDNQ